MKERINVFAVLADPLMKLVALGGPIEASFGPSLLGLIHYRVSQLNGCAFCLDMDVKKFAIRGEGALKLHHLGVWRESPLYSVEERVALELAEVLNRLPEGGVSDDLFERASAVFSEKQIVELSLFVGLCGVWNKLNIVSRAVAGSRDKMLGLDGAGVV